MIISLSSIQGTVLNIVCIIFIHLFGSWMCLKLPRNCFEGNNVLFQTFGWEAEGKFYRFIKVKEWKEFLPDGAKLFKSGFQKKRLKEKNEQYFSEFVLETKRAELTHYVSFLPLCFFFIWNPIEAFLLIIIYGVLANAPCIIVQRYNRIRFGKIVRKIKQKKKSVLHNSSSNINY